MSSLSNRRARRRLWEARDRLVVDGYAHGDAYWYRGDPDSRERDFGRSVACGLLFIAVTVGLCLFLAHLLLPSVR